MIKQQNKKKLNEKLKTKIFERLDHIALTKTKF
jgi:hypothetical protein